MKSSCRCVVVFCLLSGVVLFVFVVCCLCLVVVLVDVVDVVFVDVSFVVVVRFARVVSLRVACRVWSGCFPCVWFVVVCEP